VFVRANGSAIFRIEQSLTVGVSHSMLAMSNESDSCRINGGPVTPGLLGVGWNLHLDWFEELVFSCDVGAPEFPRPAG